MKLACPHFHSSHTQQGQFLFYTSNHDSVLAHWMSDGAPPSNNNSITRKTLYRKFWATISNTGGWQKPQYLAKKIVQRGTDTVVFHKRDIIPQCVLNLCRQKYPNPKDKPYIWNTNGHNVVTVVVVAYRLSFLTVSKLLSIQTFFHSQYAVYRY